MEIQKSIFNDEQMKWQAGKANECLMFTKALPMAQE